MGSPPPRRHIVRLALLSLSLFHATALLASAQGAPVGRAEIVQQLHQGNNQAALALAKDALKASPRDCALLSLQAIALTGLHEAQPALGSFLKALTYCPAYLPALEGAAQIEYAQASPDAAQLLERILVLKPADPTANAMLASLRRKERRCPEALSHYEAGKALFPTRPDLVEGYGSCLAEGGDYKSALPLYVQLLASNPNDSIRYDVALLQWKTHDNDAAIATLAPLLTAAQQVAPLALASKIHEEKGDTPEAVALLRAAILRSPDDADNYVDFAAIAFAHSSFQVGIDMLDAGLKRLPLAASLYVARGVLEVQLSKSEAAIADFEQAHRLDPKLSFAVDAVGMLHSQQHQSSESLAVFEAQAKQHPDDPLLQYLLAEQLSESADDSAKLTAAIAAAKRATILDPRYQAAHDLLAVLYVRAAEMAIAQNPNDQDALYQKMMALRSTGNTSEVQELIKQLNDARKENSLRQQNVDRYRLQETTHP